MTQYIHDIFINIPQVFVGFPNDSVSPPRANEMLSKFPKRLALLAGRARVAGAEVAGYGPGKNQMAQKFHDIYIYILISMDIYTILFEF